MFKLRAEEFGERLEWDVSIQNGWEIDEVDQYNPLYVLSVENGSVVGSYRLLPTTGATSLNGPLSKMFDDCVDICSPQIFEWSRFAVNQTFRRRTPAGVGKNHRGIAYSELPHAFKSRSSSSHRHIR